MDFVSLTLYGSDKVFPPAPSSGVPSHAQIYILYVAVFNYSHLFRSPLQLSLQIFIFLQKKLKYVYDHKIN